jgi:hypothetical protein
VKVKNVVLEYSGSLDLSVHFSGEFFDCLAIFFVFFGDFFEIQAGGQVSEVCSFSTNSKNFCSFSCFWNRVYRSNLLRRLDVQMS